MGQLPAAGRQQLPQHPFGDRLPRVVGLEAGWVAHHLHLPPLRFLLATKKAAMQVGGVRYIEYIL
jgi:hypothetical protein